MVTGGASGIGRAIGGAVAEHGAASVIVADLRRDPREGGQTTEELVTSFNAIAGSIIIISSTGGVRGAAATVAHSATKAAGRLQAAGIADELGPQGIRVNAICPGLIDTALSQSNPKVAA